MITWGRPAWQPSPSRSAAPAWRGGHVRTALTGSGPVMSPWPRKKTGRDGCGGLLAGGERPALARVCGFPLAGRPWCWLRRRTGSTGCLTAAAISLAVAGCTARAKRRGIVTARRAGPAIDQGGEVARDRLASELAVHTPSLPAGRKQPQQPGATSQTRRWRVSRRPPASPPWGAGKLLMTLQAGLYVQTCTARETMGALGRGADTLAEGVPE